MQHLDYPKQYLNLRYTLTCGQAFRWRLDNEGFWSAPVRGKVIRIKESSDGFLWETLPGEPYLALLRSCFRLDTDVPSIYSHLARSDEHVSELIERFSGLRLLRQEPEECLLSYICSTANSVPRIMKAIDELSRKYGSLIADAGGCAHYSFPTSAALASANPDDLAATAGLGWRGPNIAMVAKQIIDRPAGWLESLRGLDYRQAKADLLTLRGVGAKIADCALLFAFDKDEAVPVDTHIRQVAVRYYMPELKTKTITPKAYDRILSVFWDKFGPYAGWAQEFLYYEDLLRSRDRLAR
ncbi:MAG: hypothetical protein HYX78_02305 [Armatimonadetes bacterium]|nr:hypothetical protein [Armatimonadota bacterium]